MTDPKTPDPAAANWDMKRAPCSRCGRVWSWSSCSGPLPDELVCTLCMQTKVETDD